MVSEAKLHFSHDRSFLFSHIGLLSLVVGYCIMGAFIFEELERENEILVKRNVTKTRHAVTEQLWDITRNMEVPAEMTLIVTLGDLW